LSLNQHVVAIFMDISHFGLDGTFQLSVCQHQRVTSWFQKTILSLVNLKDREVGKSIDAWKVLLSLVQNCQQFQVQKMTWFVSMLDCFFSCKRWATAWR
jgi:hypothetical protein